MTTEEVVKKLNTIKGVTVMPMNEWVAFYRICSEVSDILDIHPEDKEESKQLVRFAKFIWVASQSYHED